MRTERLEAFSDGVFAVAITLLVLNLQLPPGNAPLINGLADRWPDFGAFGLSVVIIGRLGQAFPDRLTSAARIAARRSPIVASWP